MNTKAHDLFARALELEEAAREAFLAGECGDDAELRLEVQRLLVDAERADSFFGGDDSLMAEVGARLAAHAEAGDLDDTIPPEAAAVLEALRPEEEGERIGPYKLLQEIGEGGFGTVWMAEQSEPISRKVALKVIKLGMDTREVIARFEAERQALAMMDHENIAKVFDAGTTERGRPYFVMELVKGIPITRYCDEASLGTRERLELFRDVCSAINHAHQKGIIHRDIKPSNLLVTLHGDRPVVKVIDFGIAKATQGKLTDKTLFTRFEQFVGTPVYMSPEQAALSGLDIDTRSDIYALGVVLYELLTGEPPFDPRTLASAGYDEMRRIIREVDPPRPSSRLATFGQDQRTTVARTHHIDPAKIHRLVEPDLDWIVMKAIEKDRSRRYDTANALSMDIKRFLEDEPVLASPPSAVYQFRKFARRHKGAFRAAAVIALALVAATLVSSWQAIHLARAEREQRILRQAAEEARANEEQQRRDAESARAAERELRQFAQQQTYAADMKAAQAALQQNSRQQAVNLINRYWPDDGERDLRGIEWRYLWQEARGAEIYTWQHPDMVEGARFSPDGREVTTACFDGVLRSWNVASGKLVHVFDRDIPDDRVKISFDYHPDGKTLATAARDGIVLLDSKTWQVRESLPLSDEDMVEVALTGLRFSPDGRWLTGSLEGRRIWVWDTSTWERFTLESSSAWGFDGSRRISFAPDSRTLLVGDVTRGIETWDLSSRELVSTRTGVPGLGYNPSWNLARIDPRGKRMLSGSWDGCLAMWDLRSGEPVWFQRAHRSRVWGLAFSHDGKHFASGGFDQLIHVWDSETHERIATLQGHLNEIWSLEFSPDDRYLLSSSKDGTSKLWDVSTAGRSSDGSWLLDPGEWILGFTRKPREMITVADQGRTLRYRRGSLVESARPSPVPLDPIWTKLSQGGARLYQQNREGNIEVYEPMTMNVLRRISLEGEPGQRILEISPDERWLGGMTRGTRQIALWDLTSGECVKKFDATVMDSGYGQASDFSPDGATFSLPAFDRQLIRLWSIQTREWLGTLGPLPWVPYASSFSPNGETVAATSWAGDIRLFDVATGKERGSVLEGHGSGVHSVAYSPDGKTLISGGDDLSVRFWHAATGREMLVFFDTARDDLGWSSMTSPAGDVLIWREVNEGNRVRVTPVPTFEEIEQELEEARQAESVAR